MVLQTKETLTGFDGFYKDITTEHSVLHDLPLLNSDDQGVEIRYEYNTLRQTVREIVAPDKDYEAERRYVYHLCAELYEEEYEPLLEKLSTVLAPLSGSERYAKLYEALCATVRAELRQQASQQAWDVKDVETCTLFDGLQRPIEEYRQDKDNLMGLGTDKLHLRYEASHTVFGELASETAIDWLNKKLLKLKSTFAYDDWGQQLSVTSRTGSRPLSRLTPSATRAIRRGRCSTPGARTPKATRPALPKPGSTCSKTGTGRALRSQGRAEQPDRERVRWFGPVGQGNRRLEQAAHQRIPL